MYSLILTVWAATLSPLGESYIMDYNLTASDCIAALVSYEMRGYRNATFTCELQK